MTYSNKRNSLDLIAVIIAITAFVTVTWWLFSVAVTLYAVTSYFYPIDWDKVKAATQAVEPYEEIRTVEGELV